MHMTRRVAVAVVMRHNPWRAGGVGLEARLIAAVAISGRQSAQRAVRSCGERLWLNRNETTPLRHAALKGAANEPVVIVIVCRPHATRLRCTPRPAALVRDATAAVTAAIAHVRVERGRCVHRPTGQQTLKRRGL
jgi:hypothetical protein